MFVRHLTLSNFRSYAAVDIELAAGVTVFTGANGQGKTNLVEAVEFLSTGASHRVSSNVPLVKVGTPGAVVRARVQAGLNDPRHLLLEVEVVPGKANRARLNRSDLRRSRELVGVLRTVVFSPEDLAIVKGDPGERRRFIDELITSRWPRLAGVRADYERVVRQRSSLLKSLGGRVDRLGREEVSYTLDAWDDQLVRHGSELIAARRDTVAALMPFVADAYAGIAPVNNVATLTYTSAVDLPADNDREEVAACLRAAILSRRTDEVLRGVCLVGPHRDGLALHIGDLPAKGYASHGESWSLALSLRLAGFGLLRADGVEPVLVLDDVFAELDTVRRERLAASVGQAEQVLVTAAVPADVPESLAGARFTVADGRVEQDR